MILGHAAIFLRILDASNRRLLSIYSSCISLHVKVLSEQNVREKLRYCRHHVIKKLKYKHKKVANIDYVAINYISLLYLYNIVSRK